MTTLATWIDRARCAQPDANPEDWELDTLPLADRDATAREALARCEGCPVARECAAYALAQFPGPIGVIYAGVPTSLRGSHYFHQTAQDALALIAEGMTPAEATAAAWPDGYAAATKQGGGTSTTPRPRRRRMAPRDVA